jgi:hypothetical protein
VRKVTLYYNHAANSWVVWPPSLLIHCYSPVWTVFLVARTVRSLADPSLKATLILRAVSAALRPRRNLHSKISRTFSMYTFLHEELDSPAVSALGVRLRKLSNAHNGQSWDGWPKPYHLELFRASEGTLSRWSRLHLQALATTNPHWARLVGYGPFSLWVIHKEGLCPSNGDINRLMMKLNIILFF